MDSQANSLINPDARMGLAAAPSGAAAAGSLQGAGVGAAGGAADAGGFAQRLSSLSQMRGNPRAPFIVAVAILVFLLIRVEAAYKVLSGQPTVRQAAPWLRSLRDERPELSVRRSLTGFEKAIIATVVIAVAAFELWFFILAGSPIG